MADCQAWQRGTWRLWMGWGFCVLAVWLAPATVFAEEAGSSAKRYGLEKRVPWTTSRITGSPEPPPPYRAERVFAELTFDKPAEMVCVPGTHRLLVLELDGKLLSFENRPDARQADLALDLAPHVPQFYRLYGIAFDPEFETNRYCYISYVQQPGLPNGSFVSRFKVTSLDPLKIDPASLEVIITWRSGGHNGACLRFGPDGYLYISTGDGGNSFPPDGLNSGQDLSDLLASILRIDVHRRDPGRAYGIPDDNPFVDMAGARGEVWAYGLRNPWKMCFDPSNGALWVGDVGWELWEMVYRIERGGNYGWSVVEGRQPVLGERKFGPTPVLPPTVEHSHIEARSITGGYVYEGQRLPQLRGAYIYGDYVTGKVWGVRHDGNKVTWLEELVDTSLQIVSFGIDQQGELYLVEEQGTLHQLSANEKRGVNQDFPTRLSETGLFASTAEMQLAPGVIPYDINARPWMDGAAAKRLVAVPGEAKLGVHVKENVQIGNVKGAWAFPSDTVLAKTILFDVGKDQPQMRRVETQILHMDGDTWKAYTYLWNEEQTDAVLAPAEGTDVLLDVRDPAAPEGRRKQAWRIASRAECILCHTTRAGSIHGFTQAQLNRDFDYGEIKANQLHTLDHIGLFDETPKYDIAPTVDPHDESANLEARARSYIHINCAHCHRRGGGGSAPIDLRAELPLAKTAALAARPTQGTFGIAEAAVIAPGRPNHSVLVYRMSKLGRGRMPYFGSNVVDEQGVQLIRSWIASLSEDGKSHPGSTSATLAAEGQNWSSKLAQCKSDQDRVQLIDERLASTHGALALAGWMIEAQLPEEVRKQVVERAMAHSDAQVRDLFERFLPDSQRQQRLVGTVQPQEILALEGDPQRGRRLLLETSGVQCKNCHRLEETGVALGPDLSAIGKKYNRQQLLESILQPSKTIDPKFVTYVVETSDGRVISGLLAEKSDMHIVLRDARNTPVKIANDEVELLAPQPVSLMPELLTKEMSAQEVADLLAYLEGLRGEAGGQ